MIGQLSGSYVGNLACIWGFEIENEFQNCKNQNVSLTATNSVIIIFVLSCRVAVFVTLADVVDSISDLNLAKKARVKFNCGRCLWKYYPAKC